MRFGILVPFLCAAAVAVCQSAPPSFQTSAPGEKSAQHMQQPAGCRNAAAEFPLSDLTPQRKSETPAWHWDAAQSQQRASNFVPAAQSCQFNEELLRSFQAKMEPLPNHPGNFGPIPTQWPDAKFERIPTRWPNLKIDRIENESGASAKTPVPVK